MEVSVSRRVLVLALVIAALGALSSSTSGLSSSPLNDTGLTAIAVTVTFSEQVRITSYDQSIFATQDPVGKATTFRFSGGELESGMRFSMSWSPSDAEITDVKWETTTGPTGTAGTGTSAGPLTYEQIMAQIAHYPGPDEPLYQPKADEQIWLTDLDGNADIYDNDSIKINYAPGFDKSQVTRIDAYRNGVKMRFLPAVFDVLTNDQMKTFDGNPDEHSPASSHADHAIFGCTYSFRFYAASATAPISVSPVVIKSGIRYTPQGKWIYIMCNWQLAMRNGLSDDTILPYLQGLKQLGFTGIQLGVTLFADGPNVNAIFPQYEQDFSISLDVTPTDEELHHMLGLVREAGLAAYLRIEIRRTTRSQRPNPWWTGDIQPRSWDQFFQSYASAAVHYAQIAEQEGVSVFCPMTEMDSLEQQTSHVKTLLSQIDAVFSGELAIEAAMGNYLSHDADYYEPSMDNFVQQLGHFYDWVDDHGRPVRIDTSFWGGHLETQTDQRLSFMIERMVRVWSDTFDYLRSKYPGNQISFSELGAFNFDGAAVAADQDPYEDKPGLVRDDQEVADIWAAYFAGCALLQPRTVAVWSLSLWQFMGWDARRPGTLDVIPGVPPLSTVICSMMLN